MNKFSRFPWGSKKEKQCFDLSRLLLLGWPFRYRLRQLCVKREPQTGSDDEREANSKG